MLKYTDSQITFSEIPDEITLCINISNCPFRCKGCHSKELWEDVGKELTPNEIDSLLQDGVSCLLFMGGDSDLPSLTELLKHVKICYPNVKTAWYSGRREVPLYRAAYEPPLSDLLWSLRHFSPCAAQGAPRPLTRGRDSGIGFCVVTHICVLRTELNRYYESMSVRVVGTVVLPVPLVPCE